jgi:predicted glycosyl hydrolase (DUF1957 family)
LSRKKNFSITCISVSITPSLKLQSLNEEQQSGYLQLLEQREEENRQEVARLRAEIKSLKLKLFELKSKEKLLSLVFSFYFFISSI